MSLLSRIARQASGNSFAQRRLERLTTKCNELMGIGAGGNVDESGECAIFAELQRHTAPYCIFDVGANQGQFARFAEQQLSGNQFQMHCFEPAASSFELLYEHLHDQAHVMLNQFGLGKQSGSRQLFFDSPGSGLASLTRRDLRHYNLDHGRLRETVAMDTLDHYREQMHIMHIHLLKVDVEGHEMDVFLGGITAFEQEMIDMVSFEFGGCNIDTRTPFRDFFYFFQEYGMRLFRITPSGYLHPVDNYHERHERYSFTNFLAVRENKSWTKKTERIEGQT